MSFIASIIMLAALIAAIIVPLFVGHALSAHTNIYFLLAAVAGVVSAVLLFIASRFDRGHSA
ncbi:MAG: hypothetical protein ACRELV_15430 [Longimicrobiales bacterium]